MIAQWPQLLYSLLVCFGGGTLAFLGISEVTASAHKSRKAVAIAAALLLLLGGIALVISVGGPNRVISMMNGAARGNFKSLAIVATLVSLFVAIAYIVVLFRAESYAEDEEDTDTGTAGKVLGIVALVCGIALPVFMGLADAPVRAQWTKLVTPLAYVGNALAMGGTLIAGIEILRGAQDSEIRAFSLYALIAVALQTLLFLVFGVSGSFAFDALLFWGGVIIIGCAIPIACMIFASKINILPFAALLGTLVGGICIRLVLQAVASGNPGLNLIFAATQHASLVG